MKRCQKCKIEKPLDAFYRSSSSKDGLQKRCKQCQHVDSAERAKKNPAKHAEAVTRWRKNNYEKYKAYRARWAREKPEVSQKWQREHPEEFRALNNRNKAAACERLADSYVRHLIAKKVGCSNADVPAELMEAKRELLKLKRKIKEQSDANQ